MHFCSGSGTYSQNNPNYIQSFVPKSYPWSALRIYLLRYIDSVCLLICDWVYSAGYQNGWERVFTVHLVLCYHCSVTGRSTAPYTKVNQNSARRSWARKCLLFDLLFPCKFWWFSLLKLSLNLNTWNNTNRKCKAWLFRKYSLFT